MEYITTHYKGPRIVLAAAGGSGSLSSPFNFLLNYLNIKCLASMNQFPATEVRKKGDADKDIVLFLRGQSQ